MPKLENWSLGTDNEDVFFAPEFRIVRLAGEVYGHERFEDGTKISTSAVKMLDVKNNLAKTLYTTYELGQPCEHYIKWLSDNGKSLDDYDTPIEA